MNKLEKGREANRKYRQQVRAYHRRYDLKLIKRKNTCLSCGVEFIAEGPEDGVKFIRRCEPCKSLKAYKETSKTPILSTGRVLH